MTHLSLHSRSHNMGGPCEPAATQCATAPEQKDLLMSQRAPEVQTCFVIVGKFRGLLWEPRYVLA